MRYLFCDVETTGLWRRDLEATDPNQPRVVQLAAQLTDEKEKVHAQLACIIHPDKWTLSKEAEDIHHISIEKAVQYGSPLLNVLAMFNAMASSADVLVGHNLTFDLQMILREFHHIGKNFKIPKTTHCTMMTAKDILKLKSDFDDYKFPKLEEMYKHFLGGGYHNWHDALTDIIVCRILYFHMKAKGIKMEKPRDIPTALIKNLDEKKYKEFEILLKSINSDSLNDWEKQFLKDQKERYEKYKEKILVSEKQMNILRKLV